MAGFLFLQEKNWHCLVKFYPFCVTTEKETCQFLTCVWFDMGYLWDNKLSFIKNIFTYLSTAAGIWITQECTQDGQKHIYFTHVVPLKTNSKCALSHKRQSYMGLKNMFLYVIRFYEWIFTFKYFIYIHMKVFEQ